MYYVNDGGFLQENGQQSGVVTIDDGFYNLFGSYKRYNAKEEAQYYATYKKEFPDSTDCSQLQNYIDQLQAIIDGNNKKLSGGGCDAGCRRVTNRLNGQAQKRLTELQQQLSQYNCEQLKQQQADQSFMNQVQGIINTPTGNSQAGTGSGVGTSVLSGIKNLLSGNTGSNISPMTGTQSPIPTSVKPASTKGKLFLYGGIAVGAIAVIFIVKKLI